jgi:hypothetical protein
MNFDNTKWTRIDPGEGIQRTIGAKVIHVKMNGSTSDVYLDNDMRMHFWSVDIDYGFSVEQHITFYEKAKEE